jgi:cytochrome bd-type quinol oxidase subunit 2
MKKLKNFILTLSSLSVLLAPALAPVAVSAQANINPNIQGGLCAGANLSVNDTTCNQDNPSGTVDSIITTVINIFSLVVGVVSVIMIIIGGLRYITSGGDSGNVSGAKNTILYAIIGLVIVALAQVIVRFVLAKVTSTAT